MREIKRMGKGIRMYYEFKQNNSGGWFEINDEVSIRVYIEANSASEANEIAETHGIYFDGCAEGTDCDCCGDRWYSASESDGVEEIEPDKYSSMWVKDGAVYMYVYKLNGDKLAIVKGE
jgi:hypothetical protein